MPKSRTRKKRQSKQFSKTVHQLDGVTSYTNRLQYFFEAIGRPTMFDLLSEEDISCFYGTRVRPLCVEFADNLKSSKGFITYMRKAVHLMYYKDPITLKEGCPSISRYEYVALGSKVILFYKDTEAVYLSNHVKFVEAVSNWVDEDLKGDPLTIYSEMQGPAYGMTATLFNFDAHLVFVKFDFVLPKNEEIELAKKNGIFPDFTSKMVFQFNRTTRLYYHLRVEGQKRILFRVEEVEIDGQLNPIKMKSDMLRKEHRRKGAEKEDVELYIQKHAIRRIHERLDCLYEDSCDWQILDSIKHTTELIRFNKDSYLIPVHFDSKKVGYLLARPHQTKSKDIFLIHTFLFLTSVSVPEGKKLEELLGISKLDNSYLKLDKLSSFIHSDLKHSEELKTIFEECGISHLFSISKARTNQQDFSQEEINLSQQLMTYLKVDDEEFEIMDCDFEELQEAIQTTHHD